MTRIPIPTHLRKFLLACPVLFLFCCLLPFLPRAATISQTLHLNPGILTLVDSTAIPAFAFNPTPAFHRNNHVITCAPGDSLQLAVVNTDTAPHQFTVKGITAPVAIAPGDTAYLALHFPAVGIFIYHDTQDSPKYAYMGAAGIIAVLPPASQKRFFWNFHEHQSTWNPILAGGGTVPWAQFNPDYFTINGLSHPFVDMDSTAKIRGTVGDTILITMANTGRASHAIHFHGYHCRIVYSSKDPGQVNWFKDTLPLRPMETMLLELIPDKPGMFPLHDHSLMSVTGGRYYNHGMFLMMEIL